MTGINDFIINNSFRRKPKNETGQGAQANDDDVDLTLDPQSNQSQFAIDPDSVDAEFTTISEPPKANNKRKKLIISLSAVGVISVMMLAAHLVLGQKQEATPIVGAQGIPLPANAVPANLATLDSKVPSSLAGAEPKTENATPAGEVVAAKPAAIGTDQKPEVQGQQLAAVLPNAAVSATQSTAIPVQNPAPVTPKAQEPVAAVLPAASGTVAPVQAQAPVAQTPVVQNPVTPPQAVAAPVQQPEKKESAPEKSEKPQAAAQKATSEKSTKQEKKADSKDKAESKEKVAQAATPKKEEKPAKLVAEKAKAEQNEGAMESVKPLVTFSAGQIGLRSFSQDTLILMSSKTNAPVRYRVGDALPSGDVIEHLDSNSMTVVTNSKVIRITN